MSELQHELRLLHGTIWIYGIMWHAPTMWHAQPCPSQSVGPNGPMFGPGPFAFHDRPQPKSPLENTTCHICWNVSFCVFQLLCIELCKYGIPNSNDYHCKNRIEILYKKTCCAAPHLVFRADLLGNYWNSRTLTRMSTRKYTVTASIVCRAKTVICWSVIAIHKFQLQHYLHAELKL